MSFEGCVFVKHSVLSMWVIFSDAIKPWKGDAILLSNDVPSIVAIVDELLTCYPI